eukprot:1441757-Amphidinium_carterae.1
MSYQSGCRTSHTEAKLCDSLEADGDTATVEVLPGATFVKKVGDTVGKDDPITTDPNVGGFGQEEKE